LNGGLTIEEFAPLKSCLPRLNVAARLFTQTFYYKVCR
jgi:hypothetical protein